MNTIELNEQQIEFLKTLLKDGLNFWDYTSGVIALRILDKLEQTTTN